MHNKVDTKLLDSASSEILYSSHLSHNFAPRTTTRIPQYYQATLDSGSVPFGHQVVDSLKLVGRIRSHHKLIPAHFAMARTLYCIRLSQIDTNSRASAKLI